MSNLKEFLKELHVNNKIVPENTDDCNGSLNNNTNKPDQASVSKILSHVKDQNESKSENLLHEGKAVGVKEVLANSHINSSKKGRGIHDFNRTDEKEQIEVLKSDQFKLESLDSETSYFDSLAEDDPYGDNIELGKYEKDIENV